VRQDDRPYPVNGFACGFYLLHSANRPCKSQTPFAFGTRHRRRTPTEGECRDLHRWLLHPAWTAVQGEGRQASGWLERSVRGRSTRSWSMCGVQSACGRFLSSGLRSKHCRSRDCCALLVLISVKSVPSFSGGIHRGIRISDYGTKCLSWAGRRRPCSGREVAAEASARRQCSLGMRGIKQEPEKQSSQTRRCYIGGTT
jgi:hypothetical protein